MSTHAVFAEHDHEPVRGLPGPLPDGERLLWQGAPSWRSLAWHAYHVRTLSVYFALMVLARGAYLYAQGAGLLESLQGCVGPALFALGALAILTGIAALAAHRTVYSITTRRVLIRQGVALESTINLPFAQIDGASIKERRDGSGDIAIVMRPAQRVSYLWLWPHVRPGRLTRPEPSLRSLPQPVQTGRILSDAFLAAHPSRTARGNDSVVVPTHSAAGVTA